MDYSPLSTPSAVQCFLPLLVLVHFLHHLLLIILSETPGLWHLGNAAGAPKVYELLPGLRNGWAALGSIWIHHPVASRGGQSKQEFLGKGGMIWSVGSFQSVKISPNTRWHVWGLWSLPQNQHFLFAALSIKIFTQANHHRAWEHVTYNRYKTSI